jgi:hypothetical protein
MHALSLWDDLIRSRAFWLAFVRAGSPGFVPRDPPQEREAVWEPDWYIDKRPDWHVGLTFFFPDVHMLLFSMGKLAHYLCLQTENDDMVLGGRDAAMDQTGELFRWGEFEAIAGYANRRAGPAWANELLLSAYVAATPDCLDRLLSVRRRSMEASGVFLGDEIEQAIGLDRRDAIDRQHRWVEAPGVGWIVEGRLPYWSRRHTRGDFNFALFHGFLAAVEGRA